MTVCSKVVRITTNAGVYVNNACFVDQALSNLDARTICASNNMVLYDVPDAQKTSLYAAAGANTPTYWITDPATTAIVPTATQWQTGQHLLQLSLVLQKTFSSAQIRVH